MTTIASKRMVRGDARGLNKISELKKLRARTIITSPPYLDTQDYGVPRQIGFGQQQEEYFADLRSVFEQCRELSTDDATLWLVVGSVHRAGRLVQLPEILANLAAEAGWIPREQITWAKGKSLPWAGSGGFRDVSEQAILLSKADSFLFELGDLLSPDPNIALVATVSGTVLASGPKTYQHLEHKDSYSRILEGWTTAFVSFPSRTHVSDAVTVVESW